MTMIVVWPDRPSRVRAVTLSRCEPTSDAFGASVTRAAVVPLPSYRYVRLANAGGGAMRPVASGAAASSNAAGPAPVALTSMRAVRLYSTATLELEAATRGGASAPPRVALMENWAQA